MGARRSEEKSLRRRRRGPGGGRERREDNAGPAGSGSRMRTDGNGLRPWGAAAGRASGLGRSERTPLRSLQTGRRRLWAEIPDTEDASINRTAGGRELQGNLPSAKGAECRRGTPPPPPPPPAGYSVSGPFSPSCLGASAQGGGLGAAVFAPGSSVAWWGRTARGMAPRPAPSTPSPGCPRGFRARGPLPAPEAGGGTARADAKAAGERARAARGARGAGSAGR